MKSLVIITPLTQDLTKEKVLCNIDYLTGPKMHKQVQKECITDIFRYYFYGATIEVLEEDQYGNIISIKDLDRDTIKEFKVSLYHTIAMNVPNTLLLGSNGFVYKYSQSTFYKKYPIVFNNMYLSMLKANNFDLRIYTINGAIVYFQLETDLKEDRVSYKYALGNGFVLQDRNMLKCLLPQNTVELKDSKEKLSQEDVDRLFEEWTKK